MAEGIRDIPRTWAGGDRKVQLTDLATGLSTAGAGGVLPSQLGLSIRNETGGSLVAGDLVYVSGWSESTSRHLVSKADADAVGKRAYWVIQGTILNNANGLAYKTYRLTGVNTNAGNVSDPVYLSATAGGWTLTAPTGPKAIAQIVGRIAVKSATVGEVEFNLTQDMIGGIRQDELALPRLVSYQQAIAFGDFTDGGGAAGTLNLSVSIPAGARFLACLITGITGFTGDTSAVIIVGDGTDTDRYNTGTPNVFVTAAAGVDMGVPSGTAFHAAAKTPVVTITSATDWGLVVAGAATLTLFWLQAS